MRLYLDACCLNRPFDDQSQLRVHLESEAVLAICERVEAGDWTLLGSAALTFEVARIPDSQRRARVQRLLSAATEQGSVGLGEQRRAIDLQITRGLRALEALHLACAESLHADVFLTTDDRLLRACQRPLADTFACQVANPLAWLTEKLQGV